MHTKEASKGVRELNNPDPYRTISCLSILLNAMILRIMLCYGISIQIPLYAQEDVLWPRRQSNVVRRMSSTLPLVLTLLFLASPQLCNPLHVPSLQFY